MKIEIVNNSKHPSPSYETVAQMIISAHEKAEWVEVKKLMETKKGAGGFGHTGTK